MPSYISIGEYREGAIQPIWFCRPYRLFDTGGIAAGPKETAGIATYTSYLEWKGRRILWYPDGKYYLLGKYLTDGLLEESAENPSFRDIMDRRIPDPQYGYKEA